MLATKACLSLLISPSARTWSSRFSKNVNFYFLSLFNQQFASFWHVFCSALGSCCRRQSDKNRLSLKKHTGAGKSLQWQTQSFQDSFNDLSQPTRTPSLPMQISTVNTSRIQIFTTTAVVMMWMMVAPIVVSSSHTHDRADDSDITLMPSDFLQTVVLLWPW